MALMGGTGGLRASILAGAFVVLLMVALAIWLVARTGVGVVQTRYNVVLQEVVGLAVGAEVLVAGYRVGRVEKITPVFPEPGTAAPPAQAEVVALEPVAEAPPVEPDTHDDQDDCVVDTGPRPVREPDLSRVHFVIEFSIDPALQPPADSVVVLASPSPFGGPVLELRLGQAAEPAPADGRLAAMVEPSAIDELTDAAGGVNLALQSALDCIEQDINRELNDITAEIAGFLDVLQGDITAELARIREDIQGSVGNIEADTRALIAPYAELTRDTAPQVRDAIADIRESVEALSGLATAETVDQVERALDAATSALISARDALIAAAPALGTLNTTLTEVAPDTLAIAADTQYLLQQLAASLNVTLLNLESASQELAGLLADIRANPSVLLLGRE